MSPVDHLNVHKTIECNFVGFSSKLAEFSWIMLIFHEIRHGELFQIREHNILIFFTSCLSFFDSRKQVATRKSTWLQWILFWVRVKFFDAQLKYFIPFEFVYFVEPAVHLGNFLCVFSYNHSPMYYHYVNICTMDRREMRARLILFLLFSFIPFCRFENRCFRRCYCLLCL